LAYFGAVTDFGVEKAANLSYERDGKFTFIQTYLIGCTKEKNTHMFEELIHLISCQSEPQKGFTIPRAELAKIIHFKTDAAVQDSIFGKTALAWAIENSDHQSMAIELLKLEHVCHQTEEEGLECLRQNLSSSHELWPWICEAFSKFYDNKPQYWRALRVVVVELVLLSYIPYIMDIYFDITLAISYWKYSRENFEIQELYNCGEDEFFYLCSILYDSIPVDATEFNFPDEYEVTLGIIQPYFTVAFWVAISLLCCTAGFYIFFITFDSSPSWLTLLLSIINEYFGNVHCSKLQRVMGLCLKTLLICVCKLLWPFVFLGRQLLYQASPKRTSSLYQQNLAKSAAIWNNIKIVEYGLESSLQLLLQLWLLRPFLEYIMTRDTIELLTSCGRGLANFLTFEIVPACYIDKALAKILLTIFFLGLGMTKTKKKPGQGLIKVLPMFVSIVAQTVGRMIALINLFKTQIYDSGINITAPFLVLHFLVVLLIKVLFEVKSLRDKTVACCQSQGWRKRIWKMVKFFTSCLSSTIVMIQLGRDKEEGHKKQPTFLSQSAFQVLILFENLFLVVLPYTYQEDFLFNLCSFDSVNFIDVTVVIVAWFIGAVTQGLHYKYCSPSGAQLNGPHASSWCPPAQISCLATFCCKKEVQRIELNGLCQLLCKDNR
jgi:hypothetical protein